MFQEPADFERTLSMIDIFVFLGKAFKAQKTVSFQTEEVRIVFRPSKTPRCFNLFVYINPSRHGGSNSWVLAETLDLPGESSTEELHAVAHQINDLLKVLDLQMG